MFPHPLCALLGNMGMDFLVCPNQTEHCCSNLHNSCSPHLFCVLVIWVWISGRVSTKRNIAVQTCTPSVVRTSTVPQPYDTTICALSMQECIFCTVLRTPEVRNRKEASDIALWYCMTIQLHSETPDAHFLQYGCQKNGNCKYCEHFSTVEPQRCETVQ